jgi:segregation and condensation protein A
LRVAWVPPAFEDVVVMTEPPAALDPNFRIQLPNFEGPLDLLLYLIQKHEHDVLDLPVTFVTEKYVAYIGLMDRLNLDVAAVYLVMAASLAHFKSRMLLPPDPSDVDDEDPEDEIDPRAELIRRLLEYQKYKRAAEQLGSRSLTGRDVFPRGVSAPAAEGPAPLADVGLFRLLDAFQRIVKKLQGDLSLAVDAEQITIQERIGQVTEVLRRRRRLAFEELFETATTTYDLVVTFLALLEMAKMRIASVYQESPDAAIYLEYRLLEVDDVDQALSGATSDSTHPDHGALENDSVPLQDAHSTASELTRGDEPR